MAVDPEMDAQAMEKLAKFFNIIGSKEFAKGMQQTADGIEEVNRVVGLQDLINFNKLLVFLQPVLGPVGAFLAQVNANTIQAVTNFAFTILDAAESKGGTRFLNELSDAIEKWIDRLNTGVGWMQAIANWFHDVVDWLVGLSDEDVDEFIDKIMNFINDTLQQALTELQDAFNRTHYTDKPNDFSSLFELLLNQFSRTHLSK